MKRAIVIKSCRAFRKRQDAIAETWGQDIADAGVDIRFVEAWKRPRFDEHLICVNTGDSYEDNSIKLRDALGLMLQHSSFDFLFVCDDDTFVHPARWLAHETAGDLECRVYRPAAKRRSYGRPWVHGGGGWSMSRRLCNLYVEFCTDRTSADDVVVANIARAHGIEMIDRPDLYAGDRYSGHNHRVAADNTFITSHHVQPDEMRQLYEATRGL